MANREGWRGVAGEDARLARLGELIATAPLNLVSRGERARVTTVHVPECVEIGRRLSIQSGERWLDLGTGGGLPGLVLALQRPDVEWFLLDTARKKVDAAEGFARTLGLHNVVPVWGRAEALAHDPRHRAAFDGVIARAVAPLVVLVELARGFVRVGGQLVAVKGPRWEEEVEEAAGAYEELGWGPVHSERVASAVRPTWLVTMRAVGAIPGGCPRAVGSVRAPRGPATRSCE